MEPIIKETQVIRDYDHGGGNTRAKSNWALGLGIVGTVLGAAAISKQGGLAGFFGGANPNPAGAPPAGTVVYNNTSSPSGCCAPSGFYAFSKECDDVLALTKGYYDLAISGMRQAAQTREVDVAEKFGLFINNRNSIDALKDQSTAAFFDLYKYTRDKDDEASDKISALEAQVAVSNAVRPYQDKLIQCEIEKNFAWLKNYVDRKTCRMIEGVNTLPLTPEVTGVLSQSCCNQQLLAALAGGGAGAGA